MSLKRAELEKNKMKKTANHMKGTAVPGRFADAHALPDRREQRKRDQAAGLVPFAVKLNAELVKSLHAAALERNIDVQTLVGEWLQQQLGRPH